jgi:hypothetical protein
VKESVPPPGRAGFGAWLLGQFAGPTPTANLPFAEVERVCANAGSLFFGAAFARPRWFATDDLNSAHLQQEAALLTRRTADGFKASLADRDHAVIAWPWDHLATSVAWEATRAQDTSESALARALADVGASYALRHRDQLQTVLRLWQDIAATARPGTEPPDLTLMGAEMLDAYERRTDEAG